MTRSEIFTAAHKMTKQLISNTDADYRATFSLALSSIYQNVNNMTTQELLEALNEIEIAAKYSDVEFKKVDGYCIAVDENQNSLGFVGLDASAASKKRYGLGTMHPILSAEAIELFNKSQLRKEIEAENERIEKIRALCVSEKQRNFLDKLIRKYNRILNEMPAALIAREYRAREQRNEFVDETPTFNARLFAKVKKATTVSKLIDALKII